MDTFSLGDLKTKLWSSRKSKTYPAQHIFNDYFILELIKRMWKVLWFL